MVVERTEGIQHMLVHNTYKQVQLADLSQHVFNNVLRYLEKSTEHMACIVAPMNKSRPAGSSRMSCKRYLFELVDDNVCSSELFVAARISRERDTCRTHAKQQETPPKFVRRFVFVFPMECRGEHRKCMM